MFPIGSKLFLLRKKVFMTRIEIYFLLEEVLVESACYTVQWWRIIIIKDYFLK